MQAKRLRIGYQQRIGRDLCRTTMHGIHQPTAETARRGRIHLHQPRPNPTSDVQTRIDALIALRMSTAMRD